MAKTTEHPIRAARKQHGLTLEQLGEATDIHKATISKIERRIQGASIDAYRRIARILDVDWWTLVEE